MGIEDPSRVFLGIMIILLIMMGGFMLVALRLLSGWMTGAEQAPPGRDGDGAGPRAEQAAAPGGERPGLAAGWVHGERPWWGSTRIWLGVAIVFVLLGVLVAPHYLPGAFILLPFVWVLRPRRRR